MPTFLLVENLPGVAPLLGACQSGDEFRAVLVLTLSPTARKVAELLEPHIERQGYELVSVEFKQGTRSSLLRLLVDKPGGGISLNDIEKLSPLLSDLLDVYDPIEGRYMLEVASPGINRPLTKIAHFEAFRGQRVKIRTHAMRNGTRQFVGLLSEVSANGIELENQDAGVRETFRFEEIQGANYEHDFGDSVIRRRSFQS